MAPVESRPTSWTQLALNLPASNAPGAFPPPLIDAGESVIFETRPSLWALYWGRLLLFGAIFLLLLAGSIGDGAIASEPALSATLLALFALPLVWIGLAWYRTAYALTDQRVLSVAGVTFRDFRALPYDQVENLSMRAGMNGDLVFDTSATEGTLLGRGRGAARRIVWAGVPYTQRVYEFLQDAFTIHSAKNQEESVRKALAARARENKLPCQYCGSLVDLRGLNLARPTCPFCGAPFLG
jgi:Bacterial PH domain